MLDTLREFGAERLAEFGRVAAVRRRLVAHYLALAQRWGDDPMQDQLQQYRALSREHANLRAAVDYALGLRGNDSAAIGDRDLADAVLAPVRPAAGGRVLAEPGA